MKPPAAGRFLPPALLLLAAVLLLQWLPSDPQSLPLYSGSSWWTLVAVIFLAALLTEDLACIGAGLLVAQGQIDFVAATCACYLGFILGNIVLYWAGSALGHTCLHRAPVSWLLTPEQVRKSAAWFSRRGAAVVFFTRFVPGTRVASYFSAGLLDIGFPRFLLFLSLSTAIWVPLLVGLASTLGSSVVEIFGVFERWALPTALGVGLLVWFAAGALRGSE